MVEYEVSRYNNTIFEYAPDFDEALNENHTKYVMECGYTPTFDR